jgi:hypothetical protein
MNYEDELIHRCADGVATPDELASLEARLRDDANMRRQYLNLMNLDTALAAAADGRPPVQAPARMRGGWLRPYAAAAAGLVLGAVAVGTAWAMALPRTPLSVSVPLTNAGFENRSELILGGVPDRVGRWAADPHEVVERHGKVVPHEGTHMLSFLAASTDGNHVGSKWSGSDLYQVVELPGNGTRTVKIRAWFNADTEKEARFQLAAVAGTGNTTAAKELWEQRQIEGASLAFARSMTTVDHDPKTWEVGELTLQVPPQARVLVIGIAAFRLSVDSPSEWFPAQFVDEVSVKVSEEAQP